MTTATAHAAFAPVPVSCTCGATDINGCFCGTTQADWAAAERKTIEESAVTTPVPFRGVSRPVDKRPLSERAQEVGVRFVKTEPRIWNGGGFGTSPAHWVALMGDVEVGRYEGYWGDVFGDRRIYSDLHVNRWKLSVIQTAAKGL